MEKNSEPVQARRVLVVDDDDFNRATLKSFLGKQGHELVFAINGAQAVALAAREPFDIILMDVQMPVMDGLEATRKIRQLPAPCGSVPIIGLTASFRASDLPNYLQAGMTQCLAKPIDWKRFAAALARHMDLDAAGQSS